MFYHGCHPSNPNCSVDQAALLNKDNLTKDGLISILLGIKREC
jgi:hypothetical protein